MYIYRIEFLKLKQKFFFNDYLFSLNNFKEDNERLDAEYIQYIESGKTV